MSNRLRPSNIFRRLVWAAFVLSAFAMPNFAGAIPAEIVISGTLRDENGVALSVENEEGEPIDFTLAAQVEFFGSQESEIALSTLITSATLNNGFFQIPLQVPDEVIVLDEAWYEVAIDVSGDGIDEMDLFDTRFRLTAVPFALTARPVIFFNTHPGYITTSSGTRGAISTRNDYLIVAPFTTPPGGVRFNKMNILVAGATSGVTFSFGIFDAHGNRLVTSGAISPGTAIDFAFLEISHAPLNLAPSSLYFTCISANPPTGLQLRNTLVPSIPLTGAVIGGAPGGVVPTSFDLDDITTDDDIVPISITLFFEDGSGEPPPTPSARWIRKGQKRSQVRN